jgi:hypothetical protein
MIHSIFSNAFRPAICLVLATNTTAEGALQQVVIGTADTGFAAPLLNEPGDVVFGTSNYFESSGVFAAFSGLGDLQPVSNGGVDMVFSDTDSFFRTPNGQDVVGNPNNYDFVASDFGTIVESFDESDFAFNRFGVYLRLERSDSQHEFSFESNFVRIGAPDATFPQDRELELLAGTAPEVGFNLNDEQSGVDFLFYPETPAVGGTVNTLGHRFYARGGSSFDEYEGSFSSAGELASDSTGPGGISHFPVRVTDNGTVYYRSIFTQTGEFDVINSFGPGGESWDAGTDGGSPENWTVSDDGLLVQVGFGSNAGLYTGGGNQLLKVGDSTAAGTLQDLGRWIRLDNEGRAVSVGVFNSTPSIFRTTTDDGTGDVELLFTHGQALAGVGTVNVSVFENDTSIYHQNNGGQFLYDATLSGTADNRAMLLTDGIDIIEVARLNQQLDATTTLTDFQLQGGDDRGGRQAFNDWGQVAFKATLQVDEPGQASETREAIYVYTPELSFRQPVGGDPVTFEWDRAENWTLSIAPAPVHHTTIDAGVGVNDFNSPTTVRSLQLNGSLATTATHSFATAENFTLGPDAFIFLTGLPGATGPAFSVGGALTLDGELWAIDLDEAQAGDVYTLFEAGGGVAGQFDEVLQSASLSEGLRARVLYEANAVRLVIESLLLAGDYDASGDVGAEDLALVLANWGADVVDGEVPDANWTHTDGVTAPNIGADELALVLANWGNTAAIQQSLADITAVTGLDERRVRQLVPEPAAVGGFVLLLGLGRRERHNRHGRAA